jgi:hypothetical protein
MTRLDDNIGWNDKFPEKILYHDVVQLDDAKEEISEEEDESLFFVSIS